MRIFLLFILLLASCAKTHRLGADGGAAADADAIIFEDGGWECGGPSFECCAGGREVLAVAGPGVCTWSCPIGATQLPRGVCGATGFANRADYFCIAGDPSVLGWPAGSPGALEVGFDEVVCCGETTCNVTVDHASRTIALSTTLGPDPCDCDVGHHPTASCELPALEAGEWTLYAGGSPAALFPVSDRDISPPPLADQSPRCVDFAEPDPCGTNPLPGAPLSSGEVCVQSPSRLPSELLVVDTCGTCSLDGPCDVRLEPRFDDLYPPGANIYVDATHFSPPCADCVDMCTRTERRCALPPLNPGEFYRVLIGGQIVEFTAGAQETQTCAPFSVAP